MFPKLEKHCPFKARLAEAIDGDLCTICSHTVHDLDAMAPDARRAFLNGSGTACVRYRMPAALAAAALAASLTAFPAAAQETSASDQPAPPQEQDMGYDDEIVGVMVRLDPCRLVQTVKGHKTADEKACRAERGAEKAARRARGRR